MIFTESYEIAEAEAIALVSACLPDYSMSEQIDAVVQLIFPDNEEV